jgi:hypothetical protein
MKIENEMYNALYTFISSQIKGTFYPSGMRPAEALSEDAVLTVSNATADQIEEGRARLNIYVPDIDCGLSAKVMDKARLIALGALDSQIIDVLNAANTDYLFDLFQATETIAVPDKEEHFANIGIHFQLVTFND